MTAPRTSRGALTVALLALGVSACAPAPAPVGPPPVPTPAAPPTPTPPPTPPPVFPSVKAPALDVALGTDRASASFPAGEWLLASGGRIEARRGPLMLRPSPAGGAVLVEENGTAEEKPSPVALARADGSPVPYGDSTYRGFLLVAATARRTLHVVDRVNLEDYLKGVVPAEMGPRVYDEVEALKAQAVAARTYALRRRGDFASEGYDLCATPRCQVYGGVGAEQPLSSRAVDETAGEVLTWGGTLADTLFTSTCGGRTESAAEIFPNGSPPRPYLVPVPCWGETPVEVEGRPVAKGTARAVSLLGARGRALLAALGKDPSQAALVAVRNAVRERLGLPPRSGPHALWPASAYAEIVEAAGFGDASLLTEEVERAGAPVAWSARSRAAWALLVRFQLAGGSALPTSRALLPEEVAGLWASLLARLGDFEEVEGRIVSASPTGLVVKGPKGRADYRVAGAPALLAGSPDALLPVPRLTAYPGDRVKLFAREGRAVGLVHFAAAAAGMNDRESAWIHWTRRYTGGELAAKLRERDASRTCSVVRKIDLLERGPSGRVTHARVVTDAGSFTLSGLEVRFALGLPETLFTLVAGKDAAGAPVFTFYGRGWGHGVGLCQTGAFGMALAGRTYREILARYYPGTLLVPLDALPAASAPVGVR